MTSISSITKQYAGSLRSTQPQKGGAGGGGVLGFLGMGEKTADEAKDNVADPVISADAPTEPAPPAEPSLMDKALSAVGFGNKPEDAEAEAAAVAPENEDAEAAKVKAEEDAAAKAKVAEEDAAATAKAKAEEDAEAAKAAEDDAATTAPDNNVSMMDRITSVFKSDDNAKNDVTTTSSAVSNDASSDDGSDDGSDESSDDTEEDNDVDFEKYAGEIRNLRNKYQKLKAENKKLKEGKKSGPVENNNSEFSKMIASLFAIKGSVAQLEYSMKKHAGQNKYPIEGLGLDDGSNDTNNNEEQEKPSEIVSDSESDSESGIGSGSDSEPEPEVPKVMPPPPAPAPAPAPVGEIPEIPVNTQEVPAPEVPAEVPPEVPAPEVPAPEVPAPEVPAPEAQSAATTNALFSGGKNHYVHNIKKNKTLRHHKRRNRHQTLRTTQNS